jgi:hypothetical protein
MLDWPPMSALPKILSLALLAAGLLPATALGKPQAHRLADVAPLGTHVKDRVTDGSPRVVRASAGGKWARYPTKEGTTVAGAISDGYRNQLSTQVVQSYVDFLDSLDHGSELAKLRIYVAPPAEVLSDCGGQEGTLACYDSATKIMVVPGEETNTGSSGVTTSYVVAHEYGHHIAASRSNAPFSAFRVGPKYWASYERVCDRSLNGLLAPGNEQQLYFANPGEAWAETYAQLKYPSVAWQFTPLLKPDSAAFAAARRDVLEPWRAGVTKVFKGTFGGSGSNTRRFSFDLTLDGALRVRLAGPRASNYNLVLSSNGRPEGRTKKAGSGDSVSYAAACREDTTEHVTVAVKRVRGSGPFSVRVSYAG